MLRNTVPHISFDQFVIAEIPQLFSENKVRINYEYQRGDIWTYNQQIELITSINKGYSIGVLVLYKNDENQFEILDGQQRLLTILKYTRNELDLGNTGIQKYSDLNLQEKTIIDSYCVYYLQLQSHNPETKEEDILQTFLRLQEGTPLNKAEKINAYRGEFKNAFVRVREHHKLFNYLGKEKRFRLRQLAAELLLIELEGNFQDKVFPSLDQKTLISTIKKYEKGIPQKQLKNFNGNLDFLVNSLNYLLTGFKIREVFGFYLLISYLRKVRAGNENLLNEFSEFARLFLIKLNSFSMYDVKAPEGMTKTEFEKYKLYKQEAKAQTTSASIKARLNILIEEFERVHKIILKDPQRLQDVEQKRILFFRQEGLCVKCHKPLDFKTSSSHHILAHSHGGKSDDLKNAVLLHEKCHANYEASMRKNKYQGQLF